MRALLVLLFLSPFVHARGIEGTNWKVKSYKIIGEESAWSPEDAEGVAGKSVSFQKNKFKFGGTSCPLRITSSTDDYRWTVGETNPCTGEKLKGPVYLMTYENCDARFPSQIALPKPNQAIAFGGGISICLEKK